MINTEGFACFNYSSSYSHEGDGFCNLRVWRDRAVKVHHFGFRPGRCTNSPPQFGHVMVKMSSVQRLQKVHSYEQIIAPLESCGRLVPQRSHELFISNIASLL
jgi:hypothetical protein